MVEEHGLVDRLKHLHAVAVELFHPHRVVFHHVPKCGGTSIGRALRKRFILSQATIAPESSFRAIETFTGIRDRERLLIQVLDLREQMLLYHLFEDVHCISAHVRFSTVAHEAFRSSYKFVTVLREPVARFISHYRWSHGKPDAHGRIDEAFETFLGTERAKRLGATYVEYFCGLPKEADIRSEHAIASAIRNLGRMDVVGRLDRLDIFKKKIRRKLDIIVRIGHENSAAARSNAPTPDLSPALRARIAEICEPDIAVWEAVTHLSSAQMDTGLRHWSCHGAIRARPPDASPPNG